MGQIMGGAVGRRGVVLQQILPGRYTSSRLLKVRYRRYRYYINMFTAQFLLNDVHNCTVSVPVPTSQVLIDYLQHLQV